ncbi:Carbohydrate-binding family 9 [Mucilaginibacter gossypiicola]|uniref:Carbohydrate-binding family 9 n=1 Tax=Mucilaginibacter gossypiicola TaxID=551995 RepID=A0A1H8K2H4_9SPHI|nr:carbohydrate-binding family 9-like protein [Mucilaginibacter gossypiicola]SEN86608.1 Carbohydrate-binding family 9 [Mucilaginibacter gossypiicola]
MKEVYVPFIPGNYNENNLDELSALLNREQKHGIDNLLWTDTGYFPSVSFSIAYVNNNIALKYFVKEQHTRATYTAVNDPVYKDSCVEFFLGLGDDGDYYNLEFNALGTALVGFGKDRNGRQAIPDDKVRDIKSISNINRTENAAEFNTWELTLLIPFSVFIYHDIKTLKGITSKANFFKCGDELPEPHFISWNNIDSPVPNFHLSKFFGTIKFN